MFNIRKIFCSLALGLVVVANGASAADTPKVPSGTVRFNEMQYAVILGGGEGEGVLTYKNKDYPFKISGASLGLNVGVSKVSASGEVYDLDDISKFDGMYNSYESGIAFGAGVGGNVMKNENGVIMRVKSTSEGFQLNLSAAGMKVELKK